MKRSISTTPSVVRTSGDSGERRGCIPGDGEPSFFAWLGTTPETTSVPPSQLSRLTRAVQQARKELGSTDDRYARNANIILAATETEDAPTLPDRKD